MLTFFEFYETLLSFVLYKLYGELGVRYPLSTQVVASTSSSGAASTTTIDSSASTTTLLHPTLGGKATSVLAANLNSLQIALKQVSAGNSAADAVKDAQQGGQGENASRSEGGANDDNNKKKKTVSKASKKKQRQLMQSIDEALKGVKDGDDEEEEDGSDNDDMGEEEDEVPIAAPLREALEAIDDSTTMTNNENSQTIITDPEAQKRHQLFANLTFFLSREVPRGYLELIVLSYGGNVGWEGQDSPIRMDDASITHHIVDRPKLLPTYNKLPKSREYIQPQWVLDCANFNFVLPITKYSVGHALPPHLSPWVNDAEEGYVPKYKEEIEKMKIGEMLDVSDDDDDDDEKEEDTGDVDEKKKTVKDDDSKEEGTSSSDEEEAEAKEESETSEDEDDDDEAERKVRNKKQIEDEEAALLAKSLMSKKAARLYGRMQHGIAQKQAKVDNLHKKRREIESTREKSKDGKTMNHMKVERLRKERLETAKAYENTGGSMKKRRR